MVPFISAQDLEDFTGVDYSSSPVAVIVLDSACQLIRDFLDNELNEVTETIYMNGTGKQSIVLPSPPVQEILEIFEIETDDNPQLVEDEDYLVKAKTGIVYRINNTGIGILNQDGFQGLRPKNMRGAWPFGLLNIMIKYKHGFVSSGSGDFFPSSLRIIALQIATRLLTMPKILKSPLKSESIGSYNYSIEDKTALAELTIYEKDALAHWASRSLA